MSQSPQRAQNVVVLSQPAAAPERAADAAPSAALTALAENQTVGARLAAARLAMGLSLEEVQAGTKVKIAHLEAIEAGDSEPLPATPFAAGFVKAYAQFLGLDPDELARAFRAEREPAPAETLSGPSAAPLAAVAAASRPGPEKLVAYFGIGATLVAVLWIAVLAIAPHHENAPPVDATASQTPAPAVIAEPPTASALTQYTEIEAANPASPASAAVPVAETKPVETQEAPPVPRRKAPPAPQTPPIAVDPPAIESPATELKTAEPPAIEIAPSLPDATAPVAAEETAPIAIAETAPAADEEAAAAPVLKDPVIVAAEVTRSEAAKYPDRCARGASDVESVRIALDVTSEGRPDNARIVETTNDCFDEAALAAARRMRFSPRLVDGAPSPEAGKIVTVRFAQ